MKISVFVAVAFAAALAAARAQQPQQPQPAQPQPTQTQPTQAQPTQAQPTQAQPTQAQPTPAQPLQAQPAPAQTGASQQDQEDAQTGEDQQPPSRYEGPSILSRDRSVIGERGGKLLDYRFYAQVTGIYDTALIPVSVTPQGGLNTTGGAYGISAGGGLAGTKIWKHDKLSVEYHGDFYHYVNAPYFDGTDQFLNMSYAHVFSRRFFMQTRQTAGSTDYTTGYYTFLPLENTDLYAVPTNQLFDNRTEFLESRLDFTRQQSLRLSFNFGGEGFLVRQRAIDLASVNGYNAHGDVSYRLNRRQTVTLSYQYTAFDYLRQFGSANINELTAGYSIGLGRRWDFGSQVGAARVNFAGLTIVNIDPAIAAIVGQNQAIVSFNTVTYVPIYEAQVRRRFERSSIAAAYNQSFSPGNGVYLTSRQTAATLDYSYVGIRKITFNASGGYSSLTSLGQTLGAFRGEYFGAGLTYKITRIAFLTARYDFRHYDTGSTGYLQNSQRISIGLAFSPGDRPLPIW